MISLLTRNELEGGFTGQGVRESFSVALHFLFDDLLSGHKVARQLTVFWHDNRSWQNCHWLYSEISYHMLQVCHVLCCHHDNQLFAKIRRLFLHTSFQLSPENACSFHLVNLSLPSWNKCKDLRFAFRNFTVYMTNHKSLKLEHHSSRSYSMSLCF